MTRNFWTVVTSCSMFYILNYALINVKKKKSRGVNIVLNGNEFALSVWPHQTQSVQVQSLKFNIRLEDLNWKKKERERETGVVMSNSRAVLEDWINN